MYLCWVTKQIRRGVCTSCEESLSHVAFTSFAVQIRTRFTLPPALFWPQHTCTLSISSFYSPRPRLKSPRILSTSPTQVVARVVEWICANKYLYAYNKYEYVYKCMYLYIYIYVYKHAHTCIYTTVWVCVYENVEVCLRMERIWTCVLYTHMYM